MAKVLLTRKTFSKYLSEQADNNSFESIIIKSMTGGKGIKEHFKGIPDELPMWVDTDKICAVSVPIRDTATGELVFSIEFQYPSNKDEKLWFKGEQYEDFINVWAGKREWLDEGVYKVGIGIKPEGGGTINVEPKMWAEVSADKMTVTVHKMKYA